MTRDELVKAIYDSCADWTCPDNHSCERIENGDPAVLCMQCADKLLKEYEAKIKADAIEEIHTDLSTEIALLNETDMTDVNLYTFAVRIKEITDKLFMKQDFDRGMWYEL